MTSLRGVSNGHFEEVGRDGKSYQSIPFPIYVEPRVDRYLIYWQRLSSKYIGFPGR